MAARISTHTGLSSDIVLEVLGRAHAFRRIHGGWPTFEELSLATGVPPNEIEALKERHLLRPDAREGVAVVTSVRFGLLKQGTNTAIQVPPSTQHSSHPQRTNHDAPH